MRDDAVRRTTGWKEGKFGGDSGREDVGVTQIGRSGFVIF